MPTVRDALLVALMGYGGLRPEEVVPLRWSDLTSGVIVVDRAYTCGGGVADFYHHQTASTLG